MTDKKSLLLAASLVLGGAGAARAGPALSSANNYLSRDATNTGGGNAGSANNSLVLSAGEAVIITTATSASNKLRGGWSTLQSFPGRVTDLTGLADVTTSSVTLQWTVPGYDGALGSLRTGSSYFIQIASYTTPDTFGTFSLAAIAVSTSGVSPGMTVKRGATGLIPNTTYFAQLWTVDGDLNVSAPFRSTFTTLAKAPALGALQFLSVQRSSVVVAWAAHTGPPDASSNTCEGYVLLASSNNFGALGGNAPTFSSVTYNFRGSTLAVGVDGTPLDLTATYYFKVASLNWVGAPNFTDLTRLNFELWQSTGLIPLGAIDPFVAMSTVSLSSMVVTNKGNWPATIELSGDMATVPPSAWTLSTSSGIESIALQGVWNAGATPPPPTAFSSFITPNPRGSQAAGHFTGTQNGYQLAPGSSITLWFRMFLPRSTVSLGPEIIQVTAQPVYP